MERPNPDLLLKKVTKKDRGRLKIFFGYAAGVGKTYAMLEAAGQLKKYGADVVVGYVEPHTRPETTALLKGHEILPPLKISYKGIELKEFDLDAALQRKPEFIMVDELAHSNAEGMRHQKRYNDIEELLNAGINVYTTVNVQHMESLNDQIASLTGVFVRETIPDSILDEANQIELVDIDPEELLERLTEGKIYQSLQTGRAMENFFTVENLTALRELALRKTAERVNNEFEQVKAGSGFSGAVGESILVCISPSPSAARVIRTAARMAKAFRAPLVALYVETTHTKDLSGENIEKLRKNVRLAEQLGAKIVSAYGDDIARQIAQYARLSGSTKIIIGRNQGSHKFGKKNVVDRLLELTPHIDVHVIPDSVRTVRYKRKPGKLLPVFYFSMKEVGISLGILALATLVGALFDQLGFSEASIITCYILGILIISRQTTGHWYGVVSSLLAVLLFNFFFTVPRYTLSAYEAQYPVTFGIMLISALITSTLTTRLRYQVESSEMRERRTEVLFETSMRLMKAKGRNEIARIAIERIEKLFGRNIIMYLPEKEDLTPVWRESTDNPLLTEAEKAVAHWVYTNGKEAGAGTNTLPGSKGFYLPVRGNSTFFAVLGIEMSGSRLFGPNQKALLNGIIAQVILALEKDELYQQQQKAKLEIEQERLRSNMLRAISHDLRTPLTIISGSTATLLQEKGNMAGAARQQLLENIYADTQWLINLVENLLSISRIDDGTIKIKEKYEAVEEVVAEALLHINNRDEKRHVTLTMPEEYLEVRMDGKLIEQVLVNLLDNAIKYTPEGSEIAVTVQSEENRVVFEVSDNGKGLNEKDIPHLFDMFYTASQNGDSRRGLGLGLALCRAIVRSHGGEISAVNNKAGGAAFRFYLNRGEDSHANTENSDC